MGITDKFFENAKQKPEKCAIWCDGKEITYEDLAKKVTNYTKLFFSNGISYEDHIGFPINNSIESVAIMLAAAQMGCALVPINPTLPPEAVSNAFKLGGVKHLIARKSFLDKYREWGLTAVSGVKFCMDADYEDAIYLESDAGEKVPLPDIQKKGNELFIITTTSGSTGKPKPIALTQQNKWIRAWRHIELYHLDENDRILAATPLYHSLAERLVLMPLMLGATCILLPRFTPKLWLKCVSDQKVTFTIAVSAQLAQVAELLSEESLHKIDSLKCLVSSSALLDAQTRRVLIEKLSCDFHEMYGTSETSTVTDIDFKAADEGRQKSVGKPLQGTEVKICNENEMCPVGVAGEIFCKTELMCDGYYGQEELFAQACNGNFFCTGDLGYLDEEGYLYYVGRKKELIITGGINVYPIDIESCISKLEGVDECAAFAYPDKLLGEVVAVAIVKKKNAVIDIRMVQVCCAKNLADFQQPHKIYFVGQLPKNSMGKLERRKIIELVEENND